MAEQYSHGQQYPHELCRFHDVQIVELLRKFEAFEELLTQQRIEIRVIATRFTILSAIGAVLGSGFVTFLIQLLGK